MTRKLLLTLLLLAIANIVRAGDTSIANQVKEQRQSLQKLTADYAKRFPAYADAINHVAAMALTQTCADKNDECNRVLLMYLISTGSSIGYLVGDQQNLDRFKNQMPTK